MTMPNGLRVTDEAAAAWSSRITADINIRGKYGYSTECLGDLADLLHDRATLLARVAELEGALRELAVLGNEPWKTPGHPMNEWVSKERVQFIAQRVLVGAEKYGAAMREWGDAHESHGAALAHASDKGGGA